MTYKLQLQRWTGHFSARPGPTGWPPCAAASVCWSCYSWKHSVGDWGSRKLCSHLITRGKCLLVSREWSCLQYASCKIKQLCEKQMNSNGSAYGLQEYRLEIGGNILRRCSRFTLMINLLTPNVNYSGRTAPLTSKVAYYIFIQQI